ncbi:four helix bundle protein [Psychroflexus tropicus]|uniref:four helix bundle protein n=1 Tax=Psychroflexus tropicus TaxID=197345 RepID=UPI00037A274D|nr:four helix bundle protein [Psychroflexus tropicus]
MASSVLKDKSFAFALKVVAAAQNLQHEQREYVLSKQLLRSGTAIGALVREGEFAQSRADFVSKMSIALKEANETDYWIQLLAQSGYAEKANLSALEPLCKELIAILVSTVKTAKANA